MEDVVATENAEPVEEPRRSEKIDMSLDEIIKINRKEQRASRAASRARTKRAANRNNVLRKLDQAGQQQTGPSKRGAFQYQGPGRSRGVLRGRGGSSRRGAGRLKGVSPLNRDTQAEQPDESTAAVRGVFSRPGRGRGRGLNRAFLSSRGQKTPQFQPRANRGRGGRPFNRGFPGSRGKLERYQKVRSMTAAPSGGTTLTVSLPNSATAAEPRVRPKPAPAADGTIGYSHPRGVPLRFNYRASSNQTGLTLNDRFTDLKIRGRGQRSARGGLRGRGMGRGRGDIIERGRGGARGRGGIRGRGGLIGRGGTRGRGGARGRGDGLMGIRGGLRGRGGGGGGARGGRGGARGGRGGARGGRGGARRGRGGRTVTLQ